MSFKQCLFYFFIPSTSKKLMGHIAFRPNKKNGFGNMSEKQGAFKIFDFFVVLQLSSVFGCAVGFSPITSFSLTFKVL